MAEPGLLGEPVQDKAGDTSTPAPPAAAAPPALSCVAAPSFSEACGFISSRYSCLVVKTHRRHLALSPKYLHRKRSGIKENLSAELLKYNTALEGVPLAYDNIKLVGGLGDIHDDIGFIHIDIEADFVVFQPECRQRLVGVVNKKAPSHIGCLVHGCFNASIPRPSKISVEAWQQMEVNIGDELEFEVFRLDSDTAGVFLIRGRLDKKLELEAVKRIEEITKEQNANLPPDEVQNSSEIAEEAVVAETSILPECSRKKKGKRLLEETLSQNESIENQEDTNLSVEEAPKKKRKKHGHLEVLNQDNSVEAMETSSIPQDSLQNTDNDVPVVDSSVGGPDDMLVVPSSQERKAKKSKKKKHKDHPDLESSVNDITEESSITGDSLIGGLGTEPATTKKKHKKHKNTSMTLDEVSIADAASSLVTPTHNFIQQETSSKKRKPHPDLESSVPNIIENLSITGDSILEGLGTEPGTTKKKHKKHKNTSLILAEDPTAASVSSLETPTHNFIIQQETSKKKKHKDHPDLESSVNNGIAESSITGDSTLEGLGTEPGTAKKKHRKKHNTSMILNEEPSDSSASCFEIPTDSFVMQEETPKIKKHKKKRENLEH